MQNKLHISIPTQGCKPCFLLFGTKRATPSVNDPDVSIGLFTRVNKMVSEYYYHLGLLCLLIKDNAGRIVFDSDVEDYSTEELNELLAAYGL